MEVRSDILLEGPKTVADEVSSGNIVDSGKTSGLVARGKTKD